MCKIIYKHKTILKEERNKEPKGYSEEVLNEDVLVTLKVWEMQLRHSDEINVNAHVESKRLEICFPLPADGEAML